MGNKKQDIGKALIKRLALMAVDFYKDEDEIEAKACWDQLVGAAELYAQLFELGRDGWYDISVNALSEACNRFNIDVSEFWHEIAEK